jgi:hypothetical protein
VTNIPGQIVLVQQTSATQAAGVALVLFIANSDVDVTGVVGGEG